MADIIFPTDTAGKTPVGGDIIPLADSAAGNALKETTVEDLSSSSFGLRSTSDLSEGTNEYYTEAKVSANTDVAANTSARHTHSNKAVLDATTASFTSADETKLDGIETGAEVNTVTLAGAETLTNKTIDSDNNTITNIDFLDLSDDIQSVMAMTNGMYLDSPSIEITESAGIVSLGIEKSGGGDMRIKFSDGIYTYDSTPISTIALTAGSDTSPQINYVYILQSNKTLTVSTSGFPIDEHAAVGTILVQSASSVATDGAYKVHAWTDHAKNGDNIGHISHLNYWIRKQPATYDNGIALTPTAGSGVLDIATSSGLVLQLHDHTFPAFDTSTGSVGYIINHPDTAYKVAENLTQTYVDKDANGTVLGTGSSDFYNLVIWGVVNQESADCKLMINVPDGVYANNNGDKATLDTDATAVYAIPKDYVGVGFLIARLTVQESGGTYTVLQNQSLLGETPGSAGGGGGTGGTEFADNVFRIQDDGDTTKQIAFEADGITTSTTRTATMPDKDITLMDSTGDTMTGELVAVTPTTSLASINMPNGVDKTTPVEGDFWYNGTELYFTNGALANIDILSGGSATDVNAIHKNVAAEISTITEKVTPVSADLVIIEDSADSNNKKKVQIGNLPGGGGGETNTASNVGTAGVGVFKQKTGVDLEFKKINAGSSAITITDDTGNDEIDVDIDSSVITLDNITQITNRSHTGLSDIGTNTHAQIDTHISSTANPHSVTATQVGLGNVDNTSDATKNSAIATFTNKSVALGANTVTGTKADFNTAVTDGDIVFTGDDITGKSASTDALKSATTTINVSSATAPTTGQVLTATSSSAATWQDAGERVNTIASSATPTPAGDTTDVFTVTALAANATFAAPTGTPTNGQKLIIRILDDGTARTLAWNAIYTAGDVALPTTTVLSKTMYLGFIYNTASSKWNLLAYNDNF